MGLGNPGREYADTRHNIGFMILDQLAARKGFAFKKDRKWHAELAAHEGIHYCKPLSFMNLSGEPVSSLSGFYKIPPAGILAVFDDVALPLGKLRFRPSGSDGGHNGMGSLIQCLGTDEIPRLRFGIGAAEGATPLTSHVLGRFSSDEAPLLRDAIARAADAVEFATASGLTAAMNQFN
ncbi:MAG TPA: aminoacyl-tRNA hydrolase [Chthoniobacteraceae bacterium]|nr:aminoacyl-tRNA hydrolase [Chthoniobacteraceae bacterium]